MSAFFLYSQENRSRVKEESPDASFGDVVSLFSLLSPGRLLREGHFVRFHGFICSVPIDIVLSVVVIAIWC